MGDPAVRALLSGAGSTALLRFPSTSRVFVLVGKGRSIVRITSGGTTAPDDRSVRTRHMAQYVLYKVTVHCKRMCSRTCTQTNTLNTHETPREASWLTSSCQRAGSAHGVEIVHSYPQTAVVTGLILKYISFCEK